MRIVESDVVDGTSFEKAGEGLAKIMNQERGTDFTSSQIVELLRRRVSDMPCGYVDVEVVEPMTVSGLQRCAADYEGFPLPNEAADDFDPIPAGEGPADHLPQPGCFWLDVKIVPSWPHDC